MFCLDFECGLHKCGNVVAEFVTAHGLYCSSLFLLKLRCTSRRTITSEPINHLNRGPGSDSSVSPCSKGPEHCSSSVRGRRGVSFTFATHGQPYS
jgi:hypothetical protein